MNLLKYYTECIEIESLEDFSFPSFKLGTDFITTGINQEWSSIDQPNITINPPPEFRRSLALGGTTTSIYYGWPLFCRPQQTRDGRSYSWIEPVFLLKVGFEQNGAHYDISLEKEWPRLNNKVISRYTDNIEERINVLDALGLADAENLPEEGLIHYWNALIEIYPELQIAENIDADNIINDDFSTIINQGFHNRSILITASTPRYSRQLLRELRLMAKPENVSKIPSTSLGSMIQAQNETQNNDFTLSQIAKLNRSQRNAVISAFNNKISVITGPPGTGKSQVVLNILSNAFEHNKTILFTSKNNKAVDVVCERILNKISFPINLRLGSRTASRDYTVEFLDLLDSVLSGGDRETIDTEFNRTKEAFEKSKKHYFELLDKLEKLVSVRNKINQIDKEIEKLEHLFKTSLIKKAKNVTFKKTTEFVDANTELKILESNEWPFLYKFIGFFDKTYPFKNIHSICKSLNNIIDDILNLPKDVDDKIGDYSTFIELFPDIQKYIELFNQISKNREYLNNNDINNISEQLEHIEDVYINDTISYYEWLGKKRMLDLTTAERQALTGYYSVVRQLSGEYPGHRAYAKLKEQQVVLFKKISKLLPVWSVTNLSAGGHFPFGNNCFDYVVIDEASQSDIASSFPLLFRAKNAIIIGDPQQLRHISSIRSQQNNRLMDKYNLIEENYLRFSYATQSLYHCARGSVGENNVTMLNEHYRSHFSIIEFSNREWYTGNLDIRTNYDNLIYPPEDRDHLEWIDVVGNVTRPNNSSALNTNEGDRVIEILGEIFALYGDRQPSVGIVTPFAAQSKYLKDKLIDLYDENFISEHFLIADTAHKFQGDERDIMIFSPVLSNGVNNNSPTVGFLRSTSNLFNVAITRARSILWVVGDKNKCINVGIPFLNNFVEYIENKHYNDIDLPYGEFQSPWEKKFFESLVAEGLDPQAQYRSGPYFIDIALPKNGNKIAIEIDGERWHTDLSGERLERDIVRDRNLYSMGWDINRFWVHDLKYDLSNCVKIIMDKVNGQAN
jgi:very-short-patch-repair endonuclease